jgi:hypothetical protein
MIFLSAENEIVPYKEDEALLRLKHANQLLISLIKKLLPIIECWSAKFG